MNLKDLIEDDYGLQQDAWSEEHNSFGKQRQLTVVGWSGRHRRDKYYILHCHVCSLDKELFGEGYFKDLKYNLKKGVIPCGCSKNIRWNKDQYYILCNRKAAENGYSFEGFVGEWKASRTKLSLVCEFHGEWSSTDISNFINSSHGCPGCNGGVLKEDAVMIQSFFASSGFHPDTKFWRSERKTSQGGKVFWYVWCPDCSEVGEAFCGSLQCGSRPCSCSKQRQKNAYINLVIDETTKFPVALKFGIANLSIPRERTRKQNSKSSYEIRNYRVYTFPDKKSCLTAERLCKQLLTCEVIDRKFMLDGWTETTSLFDIDKILNIYEKCGGILVG